MRDLTKFDAAEIERSIATLFREGDTVEVRIPKTDKAGTISGYFNNRKALVKAIVGIAADGHPGVYCTLNPVREDLLARALNRLKPWARQTTSDNDIVAVRWLLIDLDPNRAAGISSTEEELQAAVAMAGQIQNFLSERGWPRPIVAISGNGVHLLYRLPDLANSPETTELLRRCLMALSARFSDSLVQVDTSTYNASRVGKVYGTMACKGESIESRPHRMARLVDVPEPCVAVDRTLVEEVAAEKVAAEVHSHRELSPVARPQNGNGELNGHGVSNHQPIDRWLRVHGLKFAKGPERYEGGLRWILASCPFDPQHIGSSAAIFWSPAGRPGFHCMHTSCKGRGFKQLSQHLGEPQLEVAPRRMLSSPLSGHPSGIEGATRPNGDGEDGKRAGNRLPTIKTNQRQLRDLTAECIAALNRANVKPFVYIRGGIPAHIVADETQALSVKTVSPEVVRNLLTDHADFYSHGISGPVSVPPPIDAVKAVMASSPSTLGFPALEGIIHAPSLRVDGTMINVPGYDARTRLYYRPAPDLRMPEIPDNPTSDHASVAIDRLRALLVDFPFANLASVAGALAAILTLVLRAAISGPVPVTIIDAPMQGSGKTLLADLISIIATGSPAPMFSMPKDSDEWRKQLTSIVLAGLPYAVFDNLNARLEAGEFCKVVTEGRHADRILGASQLVDMPVRTTWAATGNNVQLGGDMPRRCYSIRIEPPCSSPFLRTNFHHPNIREYAREHRGELIVGIICMARSWFLAGKPPPLIPPLGGFECWSATIGGILQHAGIEDFLGNSHMLYEDTDEEAREWEVFFRLLRRIFAEDFSAAQVWQRLHQADVLEGDVRARELRAAVPNSLKEFLDRGEGVFNQRLGTKFRELVARRFGRTQIRLQRVEDDRHNKVARWRLIAEGDVEVPGKSR